jgi:Copper type II ascorbate-dependent monooxygenase, C-terminal domain
MKTLVAIICVIAISGLSLLMPACKKNSSTGSSEKGSWTIIQEKIFTPSCATTGCHSSTTDATYLQHNLVLAAGVAYDNLINKAPKNTAANTDGLARIKPGDYLKSLLYHKIDCRAGHHSSNYGSTMPLGGTNLTLGQIEFIKQWIFKGAPQTGNVADETLLNNTTVCSQPFIPLDPPAATEGFQLKIDTFTVSPNTEREVFVRRNTPNTSAAYVNRYVLRGRPNSHHFVLYGFQNTASLPATNVLRDLYNADGSANVATYLQIQNHVFLGGGTDVNASYTFPAGVALKLPANTALDLNAHYFNKQTTGFTGENFINLYTVPQSAVAKEAKTINFANYNFSIPANQRKTITTNFTFPNAVTVFMLTSHFHKMGEKFVIKIFGGSRNGEVVYENTDWQHPLTLNLTTPIQLNAGEGLTSVATYNNTTNKTISFGLTSEDEMDIIFGYYY